MSPHLSIQVLVAFILMIATPTVTGHISYHQRNCYRKLLANGTIESCVKKAKNKWSIDSSTSDAITTCCAMYETINCILAGSCMTCLAEEVHVWAAYRTRLLDSMQSTVCMDWVVYKDLDTKCKVRKPPKPEAHCADDPFAVVEGNFLSDHFRYFIIGLIIFTLVLFGVVCWCLYSSKPQSPEELKDRKTTVVQMGQGQASKRMSASSNAKGRQIQTASKKPMSIKKEGGRPGSVATSRASSAK